MRQRILIMALDLFGLLAGLQIGQFLVHLGNKLQYKIHPFIQIPIEFNLRCLPDSAWPQ